MNNYQGQISSVLHYINQQVQKDWTGSDSNAFNDAMHKDILAKIACMSARSFQFYFKIYLNEPYGTYIDRVRLEFALQLLQDGNLTNTQIADRIGYANDTAFYNTLKKKYNYTPSQYKAEVSQNMKSVVTQLDYRIELLSERAVLFLSYIGDYNSLSSSVFEEDSWDKLYDLAQSQKLLPQVEEYWGICYDNTDITETDKCRFYACLTISRTISTKVTDEVKCMTIPSSLCAVFTHIGSYDGLSQFYDIALQCIPPNYQLSDALILEHYINSPLDVSSDKLITELWIPIVKY